MIKLMLLTADMNDIKEAQSAGVDRIFLDLEYINKEERQKGHDTLISHNSIEDVKNLRPIITNSEFLVRVNPINSNSKTEINQVIEYGADIIMLPMVLDAKDVKTFVSIVNGRAKVCLLLETSQALVRLEDILEIDGIDEVYIGLNDLHLSMNIDFMFELLAGGIVDYMAEKIRNKGIPFGFGGMGKIGEGMLPAQNILAEHYRLGSSSVILSRTFRNENGKNTDKVDYAKEFQKIRDYETELISWRSQQFHENHLLVKRFVGKILNKE